MTEDRPYAAVLTLSGITHFRSTEPIGADSRPPRKIFPTPWADIEGPRTQNVIKSVIFERFRKRRVGFKKNRVKKIDLEIKAF